jgi:hypothetical protein
MPTPLAWSLLELMGPCHVSATKGRHGRYRPPFGSDQMFLRSSAPLRRILASGLCPAWASACFLYRARNSTVSQFRCRRSRMRRTWYGFAPCAAVCLALLSASASAQQRSVQECQGEWRANAAEFRQRGVSEKAYVALCNAGMIVQQPSMPSAGLAPAPSAAAPPSIKTAKACQADWQANKAVYQAAKITQADQMQMCLAGTLPPPPGSQPQQQPQQAWW